MLDIQRLPDRDGGAVVAVTGQVDLASAPELAEALARARGEGATEVVVDLAAVDFLDSAGVRVLVKAAREAAAADGRLSVRGAHGWVARVLDITGLNEYLHVLPNEPSAPGEPAV